MPIELARVPGFNKDDRRTYVYVRHDDFETFRRFFEEIKRVPGTRPPATGSLMNKELRLVTPTGESYFAISIAGDHEAWKGVVEAYCEAIAVASAHIDGHDLVVSGGQRIPLGQCALETAHGR